MVRLWESFVANCPFLEYNQCSWNPQLLLHLDPLLDHLLEYHKFKINDPINILPFAQEYILELSNIRLPLDNNKDEQIRSRLLQNSLLKMCKLQQEERSQPFSRKCLFCKEVS